MKESLKILLALLVIVLAVGYGAKQLGFSKGSVFQDTPELTIAETSMTSVNDHAYSALNAVAQERYTTMLNALLQHRASAYLGSTSEYDAQAAYSAVLADHPELFWAGLEYTLESSLPGSYSSIQFTYDYNEQEAAAVQQQIDAICADILAEAATLPTSYEKALVIHDYLIENTSYVLDAPHGQTIVGALIDQQAVCASYAKSFQYLAQKSGIPCGYLTGTATNGAYGGRHAWNWALVDGAEVYIDVTFDDPLIIGGGELEEILHDYFCVDLETILVDHVPDSSIVVDEGAWG